MPMRALVLDAYGTVPSVKEVQIPEPAVNELLIKMEGSPINPSDRLTAEGTYWPSPLPRVMGLEGAGRVVKAGSPDLAHWVGKRVSITTTKGAWAQFALADAGKAFEVGDDVDFPSACGGIVNPLTAIGMIDVLQSGNGKGIIHTAAASSLGKMLNKHCIKLGIPILNVVRRKQQAQILRNDGAQYIVDTSDPKWAETFADLIKAHGFNCVFDAIAGGQVTKTIINKLAPGSRYFAYGRLSNDPFVVEHPIMLCTGITISGFLLFAWWETVSEDKRKAIRATYSENLKTTLSTKLLKQWKFEDIKDAWAIGVEQATAGKAFIHP